MRNAAGIDDAGTGYGRNFVSDRFSDRARVPVFFSFLC